MKPIKEVVVIIGLILFFGSNVKTQELKRIDAKQDTMKVTTVKKDSMKIWIKDVGLLFQESKNDSTKTQ